MPQIQILPSIPTFGSRLAESLGNAGVNIAQAYGQKKQSENDQKIIQAVAQNPDATPMDWVSAQSKLSKAGSERFQPLITQFIKSQSAQNLQKLKSDQSIEVAKAKERAKQEVKQEVAGQKKEEESKEWESVFEGLDKGIPYTGGAYPFTKTMFANFPWSKAAEEREAFDVLGFQLERWARVQHTKGALSTKVFNSILERVPNSKLTEAQNRGRIREWKKIILGNEKVPENLNPSMETTKMISPTGQVVDVPSDQIEGALARNKGWKLAK